MTTRGRLLSFAALTVAVGSAPALGAVYSVVTTDDVELDVQLPDTNLNSSGVRFEDADAAAQEIRLSLIPSSNTADGAQAEYLIFRWDSFGVGLGEVASGDGTFSWHVYNTLNISGNPNNFGAYTIHEIVGGDLGWDETTVTPNSLLAGAATLDDLLGPALDTGQAGVSAEGNSPPTDNALTIPEAVIQRLIDGTSSGLAITGIDPTNFQGRSHTWFVESERPTLTFETVIPEPASLALLGLGGLALLRRRG